MDELEGGIPRTEAKWETKVERGKVRGSKDELRTRKQRSPSSSRETGSDSEQDFDNIL